MSESKKILLTKAEVAEMLDVSESTVYAYANDKKIVAAPNAFNLRTETLYTRVSVEAFLAARTKNPLQPDNTMTFNEVAEKHGVTRQYIASLIKRHNIQTILTAPDELDNVQAVRPRRYVSLESVEQIDLIIEKMKNLPRKIRKEDYYSKKHDIALYQLFSDVNGQSFRALKKGKQWGFTNYQIDFIPFDEAQNLNLKSVYEIHTPVKNEPSYAQFTLPLNTPITNNVIDYFYQVKGVENVTLQLIENGNGKAIELQVKQGIISLQENPLPNVITIGALQTYLTNGDMLVHEYELFLSGESKKINTLISSKNYQQLTAYVAKHDTSMSAVIDDLLTQFFNSTPTQLAAKDVDNFV